jgi:hypothetical protein
LRSTKVRWLSAKAPKGLEPYTTRPPVVCS